MRGFTYNLIKGYLLMLTGALGVWRYRRSYVSMLICIELFTLGVVFNLLYSALIFDNLSCILFSFILLSLSAAESAIVLSMIMCSK